MPLQTSELAETVIGLAIEVHRNLGPGLLESAYLRCLTFEFRATDLPFELQVPIPVVYKGHALDCSYRADLIVAGSLLVEVKSVQSLLPIHTAQTLTYLKIAGLRQALLLNFNESRLIDGLRSLLNSSSP